MLFDVSPYLPQPLPAQIAAAVRRAVSDGTLKPGDELPSTRAAAAQAGVSRGTVVAAYDQLIAEGYLLASQGAPTRVHPELRADPSAAAPAPAAPAPASAAVPGARPSDQTSISLRPQAGAAGTLSPAAWRRAWREASADPAPPGKRFDPAGEPELRAAIADHLRLSRGVAVEPDRVIVTGGSREGLLLILIALRSNAGTSRHPLRVGVEQPGYPGLQRVVTLAGHTTVGCAVDGGGVDVPKLEAPLDALLVTPSHLYPLGGSMPAPRRAALLEWAARTGTVIIEDDFNTELRARIAPAPPLAGFGSGAEVLMLGTFATLLSRELAAGYVVASPATAETLRSVRRELGMPVSAVTQRAIAHLLREGVVRRNTRAVHAQLLSRRAVLAEQVVPALLASGADTAELSAAGGADVVAHFPSAAARSEYASHLSARGLACDEPGSGNELVLAFAHLSARDFERAVEAMG